jgi:MFS family permease
MGAILNTIDAYYDGNPRASDLMTYPTLFMGIGNLIAMPIAMAVGRRPVFLASILLLTVGAVWCAASQSLGSHTAGRDILSLAAGQSEALCPLIIQVCSNSAYLCYSVKQRNKANVSAWYLTGSSLCART